MKRHGIKSKLAVLALSAALLGIMTAGGTMAYLTDNESISNLFTVGRVEAELSEPDFPGNDDTAARNLMPNAEVLKNPKVKNTGVNDMLVFMSIDVPAEDVTLIEDDGTKGEKGVTDLFWLKQAEDGAGTHSNHFDERWIALTPGTYISDDPGSFSRYVFGYGTILAKGEETTSLFDKVQLKNILENEITPGKVLSIKVNAYAIQASNILEDDADLSAQINEANLEKIYDIYLNQTASD